MTDQPSNLRLVTELRGRQIHDLSECGGDGDGLGSDGFMRPDPLCTAAADEIERLTAALAACQTYDYRTLADEVERLRAALTGMRDCCQCGCHETGDLCRECCDGGPRGGIETGAPHE